MSRIHIRRASLDDLEVISQANARIAAETENLRLNPSILKEGVRRALTDPDKATYFVAEIDGVFAGQLMITHEWSDWRNGDIWWIQSVYVMSDFRRAGVFRALYEHVEQEAKQNAAVRIRLYVEKNNSRAHLAYQSLGLRSTYYQVMEKNITE